MIIEKKVVIALCVLLWMGSGGGVAKAQEPENILHSLLEITTTDKHVVSHRWPVRIGPVAEFLSGNPLEGMRLSFGAGTTSKISEHLALWGMGSYGFGDGRWKVNATAKWSFVEDAAWTNKAPQHFLEYYYRYDIHNFSYKVNERPRQTIFTWANRTNALSIAYIRLHQLHYQRTSDAGLAVALLMRQYQMYQSALMQFGGGEVQSYRMSEVEVRAGFGEWINISHTTGVRGLMGGSYTQNLTVMDVAGEVNLNRAGVLKLGAGIGRQWNAVPYMLLPMPRINTTYFVGNMQSFMLLRPMEFVYDNYLQWGARWNMGGVLFGAVSRSKYFPLREIISFRGVIGHLSAINNPEVSSSDGVLLTLPVGTHTMSGGVPYMELGVGVGGILRYFSLEYVCRLSYRDLPGARQGGLYIGISTNL